jgi:hypothetical protein
MGNTQTTQEYDFYKLHNLVTTAVKRYSITVSQSNKKISLPPKQSAQNTGAASSLDIR